MSDYTLTTNFAGKDALPDSSPDKTVSGTEFDTEFSALEVAVASKADTTYVDAADALKADTTYVDAADALKADITYVDAKTPIASGQIVGFAGDILTDGLVGCSAVIATDGVITITTTESVPFTANMVINATVGKWSDPANSPRCSITAIPTTVNTLDIRIFNSADTQVTKAGISLFLFSFTVLDNS